MNQSDSKSQMAQDRTDWAEDRTVLANERSFAAWLRTGMAAVGIGLGFSAIFRQSEPLWAAKGVATIFVAIGIFIFYEAHRSSCRLLARLDTHAATPVSTTRMGTICLALSIAALALSVVIWLI